MYIHQSPRKLNPRCARRVLGAQPPPIEAYFPALMRYAREARRGKNPSDRWAVGRAAIERAA